MNTGNEESEKPVEFKESAGSSQDAPVVRKLVIPESVGNEETLDDSRSPGNQDRNTQIPGGLGAEDASQPVRKLVTPDLINASEETDDDSRSPGTQDRGFSSDLVDSED